MPSISTVGARRLYQRPFNHFRTRGGDVGAGVRKALEKASRVLRLFLRVRYITESGSAIHLE